MNAKNKELVKVAFIDRDGTIINEPKGTFQVDSLEKLEILPGVIEGLKRIQSDGYKLVMVSNQDGLGTKSFPAKNFEVAQNALLKLFEKEGIKFSEIFICPHFEKDNCDCRKPKAGLVSGFLKKETVDYERSFVVGDRESDAELAKNIGVRAYRMEPYGKFPRIASVERATKETKIFVQCNLDGQGQFSVNTGLNFFNHMLEQLSKHSLIDLAIKAEGDLQIDEHHTVEDVGIALGTALLEALGDRKGIDRYGFLLPMDDTLVETAIDLGGRPYAVFNAEFKREMVGDLPTELVEHFFISLAESLKANVHINVKYSKNEHHKIEAIFKSFAKALKMAVSLDQRIQGELPTTKGVL
ncbi:bifunctional imidazole glycerol-phosphate dehydratase/histidinol phosphatase [Candidatus Kaiserbacteria bacterium RIFCSPHIGHO2_02_FULL_49_16]|uniref:Histidine biosynthesis bifunctional protein HisB n=1 Tax=Candidatus Kaiserbacteria bacterium RIFCSPHIGHO2_02_FULL_49_16 TaxID=1798490 RepID=A0A1F6D9T0_9BACT|nr:MAG: bifunctional imidazole glycerol-phosphate dehydratase/histidinol phosphatase [Candidatus Kaiserbacteria bacterium RIFCSPHIGHO2_02_FULL_49_16]